MTDTIKYYSLVRRLGDWMAPDFQKSPSSYEISLFGFLRCFKFTLSLTELLIITAAPSPPTSHASFTTCFTQSNFTLVHGGSVLSVVHIPNLELVLDSLSLTPFTQPLRNSEFQFQNKLIIWPFYTISYFPGHSDHCFLLEVQKVCYGSSVYTEKNSKSSSWPPRASGPQLLLTSSPVTLSFFFYWLLAMLTLLSNMFLLGLFARCSFFLDSLPSEIWYLLLLFFFGCTVQPVGS